MKKSYKKTYALADDNFILGWREVVCDQKDCCNEAKYCGGAQPHMHDPSECSKCPFNKEARCMPTEDTNNG